MKLCFPSQHAEGLDGNPHGHFGSAPHFVIHDTGSGETEILSNAKAVHAHGQCNPVGALGGHEVDGIVVGGIGMRALMKLNAKGIRVYRAVDGSIRDNVAAATRGELTEIALTHACGGHSHDGGGSCHH